MLYLALNFCLSFDKIKDINVPPEFVNPWIIPIIERIEILKKFILKEILFLNVINKIEKNIIKDTRILKLI